MGRLLIGDLRRLLLLLGDRRSDGCSNGGGEDGWIVVLVILKKSEKVLSSHVGGLQRYELPRLSVIQREREGGGVTDNYDEVCRPP